MINSGLMQNAILQNRYRLTRMLGQGGMGAVYQAFDLRLSGRTVAVKENFDTSPQAIEQFRIEAALLANLNHPALPGVTDYFIEPTGRQYLVMDYVAGDDLEQIIAQRGRISQAQAIAWMTEVLNALEYLHSRNPPVIHRDIKPANIKITPDNKVVLVDFGIAKLGGASQRTQSGARAGSPGYAPVEQYGYGGTDARSDIYSTGATLFFLLAGQAPPEATDLASNLRPLTLPSQLGIAASPQIEYAIRRAMAVTPQDRFQTAREFRGALSAPAPIQPRFYPQVAASAAPVMAGAHAAAPAYPRSFGTPMPTYATTSSGVMYASWGRRLGASFLDALLIFFIAFSSGIVATILDAAINLGGAFSTLFSCALYILVPCYFVICNTIAGQTLGKKLLGIQIVRIADLHPPGLGWSILRLIGMWLESLLMYCLVGFIGYLWPLWDKQHQALHDKLAGTIVVRT